MLLGRAASEMQSCVSLFRGGLMTGTTLLLLNFSSFLPGVPSLRSGERLVGRLVGPSFERPDHLPRDVLHLLEVLYLDGQLLRVRDLDGRSDDPRLLPDPRRVEPVQQG